VIHARRFYWATANPLECTAMLDEFVAHPEFLAYPLTPEQARVVGADLLTNTANLVWTTYNGRDLTGCVILTRIIPRVDALVHFMMIDKDLASKRKLLRNLLGYCFRELGFNRLSMEVPEGVRLERFARKVLDFRLEGEIRPRNPELPKGLSDNWVARQGSRREQAYYDGTVWHDVVLLRLLAREWVEPGEVEPCRSEPQHQSLPLSPALPPVVCLEVAGPVTPSPSSPRISSPSDSRTSDSSSTC
jgi:hypothetical protein